MIFNQLHEFKKDRKRLAKKFRSLHDDIEELRRVVSSQSPKPRPNHTALLTQTDTVSIWKTRLFCSYLKKKSLRIVFSYFENEARVDFIEVFHKGDKEREDVDRYNRYLNCLH